MFLLGKISQWFDTEWGGVFQLESCEEFQAFSRNHFAMLVVPNPLLSYYITPSWELRSENETYGGSHLYVKVWSDNDFVPYFKPKTPWLFKI